MYELIEHKVLDTDTASITFSSIPDIYTDLYLVLSLRSDRSGQPVDVLELKFNDDVNNRTSKRLVGDGSSVQSNTFTNGRIGLVNASTAISNSFASTTVSILNYSSSNPKAVTINNTSEDNATNAWAEISELVWNSSSPISKIELIPNLGTAWKQDTSATLYGVGRKQAIGKPKAVGGAISYDNGHWVHTFTGSGTFYAQEDLDLEYVVVAGGGGAGYDRAGGGGAGGYRSSVRTELSGQNSTPENVLSVLAGSINPVVIGAGGVGSTSNTSKGTNGSDSVFSTITSAGGGGGGTRVEGTDLSIGLDGGSGGGGGSRGGISAGSTTTYAGGSGTANQGYDGGYGSTDNATYAVGGGGGGAGGAGGNATASVSGEGAGGSGVASSITGSSVTRGVGGRGGESAASGANGTANYGNGGQAGATSGGNGGSGIVIVRYRA